MPIGFGKPKIKPVVPFGAEHKKQQPGQAKIESTVINKRNNEVLKKSTQTVRLLPTEIANPVVVGCKHATSMSINYQSVVTEVYISRPCESGEEQSAADENWHFIEEQLADRAEWAAKILRTMGEAKSSAEGR